MNAVKALRDRLTQVCYRHIMPHLKKYREEPQIEKCLPLMEPEIFSAFAGQACCDAAKLLTEAARHQYGRHTKGVMEFPAALLELRVTDDDEVTVRDRLATDLSDFGHALDQYASVLGRFKRLIGTAHQRLWNDNIAIGQQTGEAFGGLAGIVVAAISGYINGSALDHEMQAESAKLQQAFQMMLMAYDGAMLSLVNNALGLLDYHRGEILALVQKN